MMADPKKFNLNSVLTLAMGGLIAGCATSPNKSVITLPSRPVTKASMAMTAPKVTETAGPPWQHVITLFTNAPTKALIATNTAGPARKIALRLDGLHALPIYADTHRLVLWTGSDDIRMPAVPVSVSSATCELTDHDTVIVAAPGPIGFGNGGIIFTEFGLTGDPLPILNQFTLGDPASRWGASCKLKSGGCVFVNCSAMSNGFTPITIACRLPNVPTPNGATWLKQGFVYPRTLGPMLPFDMAMAEGPDGLVWLFFTSDSMGTVARIRFRLSDKIESVDYDEAYIPRNLPISPNGETPSIVAVTEWDKGRILLSYQDAHHQVVNCYEQILSANLVVAALYPDGRKELLDLLPWSSAHLLYPLTVPFPRPDGIYFIAPYYLTNTCSGGWKNGICDNTVKVTGTTMNGRVLSYSEDGWTIYESGGSPRTYDLRKYRFKPKVKIGRSGANAVLRWDEASGADQLQASTDLKTWSNFGVGPSVTPVTVPASSMHQFFRLLQR